MFARLDGLLSSLCVRRALRTRALIVCLGVSLVVAHTLPLLADELYYLWWASSPDLGYLDHPPAVMAWAWLSERALWGPRAMNTLSLIASGWLLSSASRSMRLSGAHLLPLAGLLTPFGLALGVLLTPDIPLTVSWCLTLWAWSAQRGALIGLGGALMLWSKPSALLPLSLLALSWLLFSPPSKRRQALAQLSLSSLLTAALYLPHLWWSSQHDWLPWSFQVSRPWGHFGLIEWGASQLWLMSPAWAMIGVRVAWRALRDERATAAQKTLALIGLGQLSTWALVSLALRVEGNWSALAWPPLLMLALDHLTQAPPTQGRSALEQAPPSGALVTALRWGALCAAPLTLLPLLHLALPLKLGPPRAPLALATQLERCLQETQRRSQLSEALAQPVSHIVAGRYQEMALLWWAQQHQPQINKAKPSLAYLNAHGRRSSEFERRGPQAELRCAYLYLGPSAWLGARCAGQTLSLSSSSCLLSDRLRPTLCLCPASASSPPSPSGIELNDSP